MRRIVLALLLCLGLFTCQTAFSQDYNVLIYPQNQQITSYLQAFFPSKRSDLLTQTDISQRSYEKELKANGEALSNAYKKEDDALILEAKEKYSNTEVKASEEVEYYDVKLVSFSDTSIDINSTLKEEDLITFDYIASSCNANLIIIPYSETISGFNLISLYVYNRAEKNLNLIYEELSQIGSSYSLKCLLSLASIFSEEKNTVLTFDGIPQGAKILVDGQEISLYEDTCILKPGNHTFDISLEGYETKHLRSELTTNEVATLYVTMNPIVYDSLLIEANPISQVSIDGKKIGTTPYILTNYTLPLILGFSSEGYVDKTVGLYEPKNSISISLKPSWLNDEEKYEKYKRSFYDSFARSILIFGLKLVSQSLDVNNSGFWNITDTLCTGALYLSLTDLAGNLINYYRYSEYISP